MKKKNIIFLFALLSFHLLSSQTYALEKQAGNSAILTFNHESVQKKDPRVDILKKYLESRNSPMAAHAETFIAAADEQNLDWKLVASIAGLESSFGKHMPYNSYNAWGWGVYGDNVIRFKSFDDGIYVLSKGLRERYINKLGTEDLYVIGKMYASSPTWAQRVTFFMNDIERFAQKQESPLLSISI